MRSRIIAIVLVVSAGWVAAEPPSDRQIIISPKGTSGGDGREREYPGFIIIRPGEKTAARSDPPRGPANPSVIAAPSAGPIPLGKRSDSPSFDYWFTADVEGQRIGYLHWTATEIEKDGKKFLLGVKHQRFTVDRFGQVVAQFGEESTVETAAGEVLVASLRQGLGKDQALALSGVVEGNKLKVTGEGGAKAASKEVPWPGGVTGAAAEPRLFREQKLKPGERFEYLTYVGQLNRVVKVTVTFEAEETVAVWPKTPPRKLRRYLSKMEPVGKFKLPDAVTWVDVASGEPLRVEFDFPGFGGRVRFLRASKESATAPVANPIKLFNVQSIRLNVEIPGIHGRKQVLYKVSMPRDDDPGTAFPSDAHQEIRNLDEKARTFELNVSASRGPVKGAKAEPAPGKEYLGSSFFINWDNEKVKAHAREAIAGLPADSSDWSKARAVELWVNRNMRSTEFSQAMATADNVAKTLSGDCTEYAMLAAAMSRAAGVPSRTVLGLVYAASPAGKPFLAYHMWFEVYADGQWLPLDATLGLGGIGPGHVKIADHSWHDERTFAPLLPVLRVLMAKPTFEVLKVGP